VSQGREKIINAPVVVTRLLLALAAIQLLLDMGPPSFADDVVDRFGFVPGRFLFQIAPGAVLSELSSLSADEAESRLAIILGGGVWNWVTPVTYAFLHANWTHLILNGATLAAFGSPLARRFGAARFLAFFFVCALAGAAMHLAVHPYEVAPVIGASAAISGTMAAIARFVFEPRDALGLDHAPKAAPGFAALVSNRRAVVFLVSWFGVNFLIGAFPQIGGVSEAIAWEAHIGGFLAGLFLFSLFDPPAPRSGGQA